MKHTILEQVPRIVFSKEAYFSIFEYCRQSPGEITGFGSVNEIPGGLYVDEVYIMPQEITGGHCEISGKTLLDFMEWCNKNERQDLPPKARLWWHSHNNFSCFRSETDRATCEMLLGGLPYLLCIVANKAGQSEVTLHYPNPRLTILNLRIEQTSDLLTLRSQIKEEVAQKVTEKSFYINPIGAHIAPPKEQGTTASTLFTDDQLVEIGRKARESTASREVECHWCNRIVPEDRLKIYPGTTWCGESGCEWDEDHRKENKEQHEWEGIG